MERDSHIDRPLGAPSKFTSVRTWLFILIAGACVAVFLFIYYNGTSDTRDARGANIISNSPASATSVPSSASASQSARVREDDSFARDSAPAIARIVNNSGAPIANAIISIRTQRGDQRSAAAKSAADGTVATRWMPEDGKQYFFAVAGENYISRSIPIPADQKTLNLGDVALESACALDGKLTDREHRALGGWRITGIVSDTPGFLNASTAADGTFHFAELTSGIFTIRLSDRRYALLESGKIIITPNAHNFAELTAVPVDPAELIEGIIVNENDAPVARAIVAFWSPSSRTLEGGSSVTTDDDGRFVMKSYAGDRRCLEAWDSAGALSPVRVLDASPGRMRVELKLTRRSRIVVKVTSAAGAAVEKYYLTIRSAARPPFSEAWRKPQSFGGREKTPYDLEITNSAVAEVVSPGGGPFVVDVDAPEFEPATVTIEKEPAAAEPVAIVLIPKARIRGRVLSAAGPVAGATVDLRAAEGRRAGKENYRCAIEGTLCAAFPKPVYTTKTDARGEFTIWTAAEGSWVLSCKAAGYAPGHLGPSATAEFVNKQSNEIVISAGGSIRGKVIKPDGIPTTGTIVVVADGISVPRSIRCDGSGEFRFAGLTPGAWRVFRTFKDIIPARIIAGSTTMKADAIVGIAVDVAENKETTVVVDLTNDPVLKAKFEAAEFPIVEGMLDMQQIRESPAVFYPYQNPRIGSNGECTLFVAAPGHARVHAILILSNAQVLNVDRELDFNPGINYWNFQTEFGSVSGYVKVKDPRGVVMIRTESPSGTITTIATVAKDGSFKIDAVPAGRAEFSWGFPGTPNIIKKSVDVPARGNVNVILE